MKFKPSLLVACAAMIVHATLFAQYGQQGPKLVGTGAIGNASQGIAVSVSANGNTLLVGGSTDSSSRGAAWVFTRNGTSWTQQGAKLVGSGAAGNSPSQGTSVDLSADGNTAIVGGPGDGAAAGAAWIFVRSGNVWTQQGPKLIGSGATGLALQGASVGLSADGNTAVVGGTYDDNVKGAIWIFTRSAGVWTQQGPKLVGAGAVGNAGQGGSVSISADGNTVVVGGGADNNSAGAAWVFTRTGTTWSQQGSKLVGSGAVNGSQGANQGQVGISADGNTIAIGGFRDNTYTGATWIFTRSGNVWTQQGPKLVGTGVISFAAQGASVSVSADGNTVVAGGLYDNSNRGAAWVFRRSDSAWTQLAKLTGTGTTALCYFGYSVSISNDANTIVAGGPWDNAQRGATWAFGATPSLAVTSPSFGETVLANAPYEITWQANLIDSVRLELSLDSGVTYTDIVRSVPSSPNHYRWMMPDTLSTRCFIRISNAEDSLYDEMSSRFNTKGYVLTRFDSNGNYEVFAPQIHGWRFGNFGEDMWPQSWWSQFDYNNGIDPNTGWRYFYPFNVVGLFQSSNFIDWPLFVESFQPGHCYKYDGWVTTKAFEYWRLTKDSTFDGGCAGFATSAFLAFDRPAALRDSFPSIGSFDYLNQVLLNDETRKVNNKLFYYQYDPGHMAHDIVHSDDTPRETLQGLKHMLFPGVTDNKYLVLRFKDPVSAHAVNGIGLKVENRTLGRYRLYLYDNNYPDLTIGVIVIDSSANTWSGSEIAHTDGLYLSDPVSSYLRHPMLPGTGTPTEVATAGYIQIYNTPKASVAITDQNGNSIGFADSAVIDNIPGSVPIIPRTSKYHPPIGYYVPGGTYGIRLNSFANQSAYFTAFGDTISYSYRRSDALASQTDNLRLANGFSMKNGDADTKQVNLRTIVSLDTLEMTLDLSNIQAATGDSMLVQGTSSGDLVAENHGSGKSYDLNLYLGSPTRVGAFAHPSIAMSANSSHRIVPSWNSIVSSPVKIFVDLGIDGTVDDTLLIDNTVDVKDEGSSAIPLEFALSQNYPNPFNPTTSIRYALPVASRVRLELFSILGQRVATIINDELPAGYHTATWNGKGDNGQSLGSGTYLLRLTANGENGRTFTETRKMMLLK